MSNRLKMHDLLLSIGGPNVYFQIPDNMTIQYPAIKYSLNKIDSTHANNLVYTQEQSYLVTIMSKNPDEEIVDKISRLPKCSFDRKFTQDNIHHTIFNIYA